MATCFATTPLFAQGPFLEHAKLKVNEPVRIENTTLQPGNYELRLLNDNTGRVVQIYNLDSNQVVATVTADHDHIQDRTALTQLRYWETPAGSPPALRAWFWPGDNNGVEFPYPAQAEKTLAASQQSNPSQGNLQNASQQARGNDRKSVAESAQGR